MSSDGANVDLAKKMPNETRVGLTVALVGACADINNNNTFMLYIEVVNRLKVQVTVAPDPAPPQSQAVQLCSPPIATRMAGPPETMEVEAAIAGLLASLTSWKLDSDKLTLHAEQSGGRLVFSRGTGGENGIPLKNVDLP